MSAPRRSRSAESLAIVLACVALAVGLALAAAMDALGLMGGGVFVALLILPLTVYLIASGRLEEFTGPGGWRLKLRAVADQTVPDGGSAGHLEIEPQTLQVFEKSSLEALRRIRQQIRELGGGPVALTLRTQETTYGVSGLAQYLRAMMAFDPDMSVIVVDPGGGFLASTTGQKLAAALGESPAHIPVDDNPDSGHAAAVVSALQHGDLERLGNLLSTSTAAVRSGETNIEALKRMMAEDMPSMIVVDDARRPVGIVRRDRIVARMMADLLAP